jgi:hypothetical protein
MKRILILFLFLIGTAPLANANDPVADVAQALNGSNPAMIASYFDSSIDMKILSDENIYSRQQARILLSNFLTDKRPAGFNLKHQGGPANAQFAIGEMYCIDGTYRVYFLMREKNSTNYIYKFRIEKND